MNLSALNPKCVANMKKKISFEVLFNISLIVTYLSLQLILVKNHLILWFFYDPFDVLCINGLPFHQSLQEVSQKSDKISQLEREKATLIRDMFESRSKNRNANYDDTTFM